MPPKRAKNANTSRKNGATGSRKRVKKEEAEDNSNPVPSAPEIVQNNVPPGVRDANYYFEDGSITLRVRKVLFKVHGSLLKVQSEEFCNKYNLCPQSDDSPTGGTCDEDAIVIPDIQPSQFRNLMRIIYCLPSNSIALSRSALNDKSAVVGNFDCYLDIATLSCDFGMERLEQWAKQELASLVHISGKDLAEHLSSFTAEFRTLSFPAEAYYCFKFLEAIWYAKFVSDNSLFHGTLAVMQHHCGRIGDVKLPISFLKVMNLREVAPSLVGFLFLLLLRCGNSAWMKDDFTQEDRLALFSAQSFLTPLPKSLKEPTITPLFQRPSAIDFVGILSNDASKGEHDGCPGDISSRWGKVFPASYYREVNGDQFSVSIGSLIALPSRRFDFITQLRSIKCQACYLKILDLLDRDIQGVFTKLAEYYKVAG